MTTTTEVKTNEILPSELANEIEPLLGVSREIVVSDAAGYNNAGQIVKDLTRVINGIAAHFTKRKRAIDAVKKLILEDERNWLRPLEEEKEKKVSAMRLWFDEQERIRRVAQAKAEEEARKAAEEAALEQAVALESNGHKEAAEAVMATPVVAPAVYVPPTVPKGMGQFMRKNWGAEVTDLMALVKAVAVGTVPIQALEANMVFLNGQSRMLKSALSYPGVRAIEK